MKHANVAITGLGAVSPLGLSAADMWKGLVAGTCGISKITAFDPERFTCDLAGQVPHYKIRDFVPKSHRKQTKLMCRDIELAVIAAHDALTDAGLVTRATDPDNININPTRTAINIGAGLISCDLVELAPAAAQSITDGIFDIHKWGKQGLEMVTPLWLLKYLPNMLACHLGIIHDIQGPSNSITCAEAAAHIAIAEAAHVVARNAADVALAGGAEAKVNPVVFIRQCLLKRAAVRKNDSPDYACRPFDENADGSVFGEAAGIVILEKLEHAQERNATIYAQLLGAGQSNSINTRYEQLEPDGSGIRLAIEQALADAEIEPNELDLIIPHGTGIPADDLAEARGIQDALGDATADIPVWPTKSMLSNTGAAGGALDVVAAACAMKNSLIPRAKNCEKKAKGCNLNIVTSPLEKHIRCVLLCSYTYGGQTAALVLKNLET